MLEGSVRQRPQFYQTLFQPDQSHLYLCTKKKYYVIVSDNKPFKFSEDYQRKEKSWGRGEGKGEGGIFLG